MALEKLDIRDMEDIFKMCNQDKPFLVKVMSHLEKEFFESKIFTKVFLVYKNYFEKYQKSPTQKIFEDMLVKSGEDDERVSILANKIFDENPVDPRDKEYMLDGIVMHAKKQRMKQSIERAYGSVEEGAFTDDKFQEIVTDMKESVKFSIDTDLGVDIYDIDARYEKIKSSMGEKISTGYSQIDHYTGGGFARKELVAIQAPPGIGKCGVYNNTVEIEIDESDPLYEKIKHLLENK